MIVGQSFKKHSLRIVVLLCVIFPFVAQAAGKADTVYIPFGNSGVIAYDLKSGLLNVYKNKCTVFSNAFALVEVNGRVILSTNYTVRTYSKSAVSDGFGKGEKYAIKLVGDDLPEMEQVFYTYTNREYFLTKTVISGANLKSNYMEPFSGNFSSVEGDVRTLFVPFDNDTFINYDAKPFTRDTRNISAEVTACYENNSRKGWVIGSIDHKVWKTGVVTLNQKDSLNTVIAFGGFTHSEITRDKMRHGSIAGATLTSPLMFIGCFDDWRNGLEEYGKANRIAEPPYIFNWTKPTPVGWNSWGVMQDKLTYDKAIKVADFFADSLADFRTGNTAFIDLDSYWDNLLKGGMSGDFSKLKAFADYCKSKGLQPGVYWAPFTDWGYKAGGDRKAEGSEYKFGDMWTKVNDGYHDLDGARALDPTHPGTQQRIAYVIKKLKDCGFKMIKIDFLGHASIESSHFYDTTVTTGMQAYGKGMEFLLDQLGNQMLVYAAISPSLATGRYAHSRRIACDAFKSISDTKYTLNSVNYGWWQTYVYNFIDADHVVLSNQSEGENRARMLSSVITGTFITGDDFASPGPWSGRAMKWYQQKGILDIVKNGKAFEPVEGNTGNGATAMFTRKIGGYYYLGLFNYNNAPTKIKIDAARIGLSLNKTYKGTDLIKNQPISLHESTVIEFNGADAALYKFKLN
ncbi:MAG: alpha-galactosidase [Mucilaginibacter sp.]|nr:alpha-galactosidase [Mucilaginibacter sp.]